jgi:flavin-dependent dehydrogenase
MIADAMVVGGGIAGSALAARLAGAGREVVLIEREAGPVDKVCGEFLSREAGLYLAALGVDLASLGAVPIDTVRLCERDHTITVALPFSAWSLSRRVLDEALLERAKAAGATLLRGCKVNDLSFRGTEWVAKLDEARVQRASAAFLATGKHDLRGHRRPAGMQDDLLAFKLHWQLAPEQAAALVGHVELILFDGGYAGLQPIEGGLANLCLLVRRARFLELGARWPNLLAAMQAESPHLEMRLTEARACWDRPLALSAIPYGHVQRHAAGPWRLGDQAAVIPSFSGDGMSIALHSAELASSIYLSGGSAESYQRRLARDVRAQVFLATILSQALVRRRAQRTLGAVARMAPRIVSTVALRTRISDAALARAALGATA